MKLEQQSHQWFSKGVAKHVEFNRQFKLTRQAGVDAAFFFLQARACVEHGDWAQFCELQADKISPRQVRFYIQLAEEAIQWVQREKPGISKVGELHLAAREMVMQSPKGLVALCRELGHMRKFGEYDEVKYANRKLGRQGQIEFDFAKVLAPLDVLAHFGDENYTFTYPEGKDQAEFITEVEAKLEAALQRVRQIKQSGRAIET